ncbi:MAG: hypothetical protein U9R06_03640 [Patescibacteria group bacterium]|nr:hypothetical protein [Patescibacteria group bacterium]
MKIVKQYSSRISLLIILAVIIFFGINFGVYAVSAQTMWDTQLLKDKDDIGKAFGQDANKPSNVRVVAVNLIKVVLTFVAIIMIAMILIAGFRWMTAGGSQEAVSDAKSRIKNAVIGLIIILASYMIVDYTARCIMDITGDVGVWMCKPPY